jgi:hypothetical protein
MNEGRTFGPTDHHFYIAWANSLARHLAKLGLEPAKTNGNPNSTRVQSILSELGHGDGKAV